MKKWIPILPVLLLLITLGVPAAIVALLGAKHPVPPLEAQAQLPEDGPLIRVSLKETGKIITLPLEEYVKGVVAAEMPASFALEALKAQAVAARTNVVRRLQEGTQTAEGADISDDYTSGQAYCSDEKLRQLWGTDYSAKMQKIITAVAATQGEILTYGGRPIDAAFFSTSNGYTEASEDYWGEKLPYLRSVPVPWDAQAPRAHNEQTLSLSQLYSRLGVASITAASPQAPPLRVLEETPSQRVKSILVGDKILSGRQFREALGLYSTAFQWQLHGDTITFYTRGYGHGVGMSQYGAEGMARAGYTYQQILTYFYQGVKIGRAQTFLAKKKKFFPSQEFSLV